MCIFSPGASGADQMKTQTQVFNFVWRCSNNRTEIHNSRIPTKLPKSTIKFYFCWIVTKDMQRTVCIQKQKNLYYTINIIIFILKFLCCGFFVGWKSSKQICYAVEVCFSKANNNFSHTSFIFLIYQLNCWTEYFGVTLLLSSKILIDFPKSEWMNL